MQKGQHEICLEYPCRHLTWSVMCIHMRQCWLRLNCRGCESLKKESVLSLRNLKARSYLWSACWTWELYVKKVSPICRINLRKGRLRTERIDNGNSLGMKLSVWSTGEAVRKRYMDVNECDCMTTGTAQRMRARLSSLGPAKAGNKLWRGLN